MKYSILQRNKIIREVNNCTGAKKFNVEGLSLFLNKHTLVPHPDTSRLVQLAVEVLEKNSWVKTIADVGTGSGIIAISLAKKFPARKFYASDVCKEALNIAKKNSVLNKTSNICFLRNTNKVWLSEYKKRKVDFIVSNPPFVGEEEFNSDNFLLTFPEVKLEPVSAIVTQNDKCGLSPYLKIIKYSDEINTKLFLFQCNSKNVKSLLAKIHKIVECRVDVSADTAGLERFLLIRKIGKFFKPAI